MATKQRKPEPPPPPSPAAAPAAPPAATSIADLLPGWSFRRYPDGGWVGCTRPDGTQVNLQPSDKVHSETLRQLIEDLLKL